MFLRHYKTLMTDQSVFGTLVCHKSFVMLLRHYKTYIYIYIKFTEASHHNTLNMTQNRWM